MHAKIHAKQKTFQLSFCCKKFQILISNFEQNKKVLLDVFFMLMHVKIKIKKLHAIEIVTFFLFYETKKIIVCSNKSFFTWTLRFM